MQKVVGRILFIGFSIQIALGICWMVCNFAGYQQFGESALYLEISKTLICDEYRGILYPILIRLARGIEGMFFIPYHCILYVLQIGFAYFAAYKLLQNVGVQGKGWQLWGSLGLLTFPMAMQCHLAVLPDSAAGSCLILELAYAIKVVKEGKAPEYGQFVKVLLGWLAAALLEPVCFYVGAVPVLLLFLYGLPGVWKRDKRKLLYNGILAVAFVGVIGGTYSLTQTEGYYGRPHQSWEGSLVSRIAWLNMSEDYGHWPAEIQENIEWLAARECDYYADNMERILGKTLEEAVGRDRAEAFYLDIAKVSWVRHRGQIVTNALWDAGGYVFAPAVLQLQFEGAGYDSYSGRNYDIMSAKTPALTKYYMDYGCWWFVVGFVLTALFQGGCRIKSFEKKRKGERSEDGVAGKAYGIIVCVATSAMLVLLYTLRGAGMMDYKKSVAVTLLWLAWMLLYCVKSIPTEDSVQMRKNHGEDAKED